MKLDIVARAASATAYRYCCRNILFASPVESRKIMQRAIVAKQGGLFKSKKTAKKASGTVKKSVSRPGTGTDR
jgi:hypothetical protein